MMQNHLKKFVIQSGPKIFMSTAIRNDVIESSLDVKKLEHYRNLNALDYTDVKPAGWDQAKSFKGIPGPKSYPIIGNSWRFLLPVGDFYKMDFLEIHKRLYEKYGDVVILKGLLGRKPMVILFNVEDIEKLYRNEGVWPIRNGLESFQYYRRSRQDIFKNAGLLTHHGEEWFKIRSVINPVLMQPRNVLQYVDQMNLVADDLVSNVLYFSKQAENGEMPADFHKELYKWSLESIGVITMDKNLGCLKRDAPKDSEPQKLISNVLQMFSLMYKLDVLPSIWKIISTRDWKEYVAVLNFLSETNLKYINQYLDNMKNQTTDDTEGKTNVLQKLVKLDRSIAIAMCVDMMIAGVDTTGKVLAAALYHLSKNPLAQEKLRQEAVALLRNRNSPVTKEILSKATYLKATIKETTRLSPIAIGNLRTTVRNLVLGDYQIPTGTDVLSANLLLCHMDKYFVRANEFFPERWLSETTGELSHKNTNPFLFAPFGYGPRSCAGKRLANLELEVALLKIARNFKMEWPHEDMVFTTSTLHGIARPLKIHVKPLAT